MTDTKAPSPAAPAQNGTNGARRRWLTMLLVVVVVSGLIFGLYELLRAPSEETDDAYVAGDVVAITAQDPGLVQAIYADDTQMVKPGQPLIDLDPATADIEVAAAEAQLARAVRGVRGDFLRVNEGSAEVANA